MLILVRLGIACVTAVFGKLNNNICLSELNNFNSNDFAKFHPGGSIGKKLSLDIGHIALKNEKYSI